MMTVAANWQRLWLWFILAGVFLVSGVVLDILAYRMAGNEATLSVFVRKLGRDWPIVPWAVGLVMGGFATHWWWAQKQRIGELSADDLLAELARRQGELTPPATVIVNAEAGATTTVNVPDAGLARIEDVPLPDTQAGL